MGTPVTHRLGLRAVRSALACAFAASTATAAAVTTWGVTTASASGEARAVQATAVHQTTAVHAVHAPAAATVVVHAQSVLDGHSYSLITDRGGLVGFGAAISSAGLTNPTSPFVGGAPTPDGKGAWIAAASGAVEVLGDASFYGSMGGQHLDQPIVGMAATPTGGGYWLVAADGGIFSFGDASFYGSMGGQHLDQPIVGMAATPTGGGYWLVAADGGVFTFGDAPFFGSGASFGRTVVGIAQELGGYQDPLRTVSGLTPERVDQGVDYAGSGPIYAIGDGVVLNTTNSGWPGGAFIAYQLSDGPAAGDIVYVAENVVPRVTVGQQVNSDTVVGTLLDTFPHLETGWANPPGTGESLARAMGQWSTAAEIDSLPTAYGANFSQLLTMLGAPAGVMMGPVQGAMPAGWPSWVPVD